MLATILLSHGTPMILAGDEFGHTKRATITLTPKITKSAGSTGWASRTNGGALREFTRRLIATRQAFPILYRSRFLVGSRNEELDVNDVTWLRPTAPK